MDKIIYLATTCGCSACKCQKHLLDVALRHDEDTKLEVYDFTELPEWIKTNVPITDFPTTILTEDEVIRYHFKGTMPVLKFKKLREELDY